MSSAVAICNVGLAHLGADQLISSISPPDGSREAGYCATFYPIARRELIDANVWSFVKKRAVLAAVANPSSIWEYAYALPSDCVQPLRVLQLKYLAGLSSALLTFPIGSYANYNWTVIDGLYSERGSARFEIEGGVLLTNEPEATLLYKTDVTDPSKFTPLFESALGMLMASYLAGPLIKGAEGMQVGAQWRKQALMAAERAEANDANAGSERAEHVPTHIAVRL